ncbi:MAG: virginiamycin B lyase family protein, partial [Ardenticatenaceae bacterium]
MKRLAFVLLLGLCLFGILGAVRPTVAGEAIRIVEYALPPNVHTPRYITAGPDGKLWFTAADAVMRMTPQGESEVLASFAPWAAYDITTGPDDNLWMTLTYYEGDDRIARITPEGAITYFTLPDGLGAVRITTGPDGNLWFTTGGIGRITPQGEITIFDLPDSDPPFSPHAITTGPDDESLWFTKYLGAHRIG